MKNIKRVFCMAIVPIVFITGCNDSGNDSAILDPIVEPIVVASRMGDVFGDLMPDAPELAARGSFSVGVKTVTYTNPDQINVIGSTEEELNPVYDRPLTVEIWYPASLEDGVIEKIEYTDHIGADADNIIPFTFEGRAVRDASANDTDGPYPLVIISHGYPGSRVLMSYLGENLASKGYIVAAIGHTDSLHDNKSLFASTMVNRSMDQKFIIDKMLAFDNVDQYNVGLVGYSMGGYGAIRTLGGQCNEISWLGNWASSVATADKPDSRIKAAILFAPWGGGAGVFDMDSLENITAPTLWIAGSRDDISGYDAIVNLFEASVNSDRRLLTYDNALHNVAPNPAPPEAVTFDQASQWSEPVWDTAKINNINQHFVTAFLDLYLKADTDSGAFLDVLVESSNDGVYEVSDGVEGENHTYWPGFNNRTALGLNLRHMD